MDFSLSLLFSCLLAVSFLGSNAHVTPDVTYEQDFLTGIQEFTGNLYQTLAQDNDKNFVVSPISVMTLLGMAGYGAEGQTKDEVVEALRTPIGRGIILRNYRKLLMDMNAAQGVELHLATKLFIQNGFELEWVYKHVTDVIFQSSTQNIDFQEKSQAANTINSWAQEKTNNKISQIVSAADLEATQLVLSNAAYFKGQWENSFSSEPENKPFYSADNSSTTSPMMCNNMPYSHGLISDADATYVELPYESKDSSGKFSNYIVFPNKIDGLGALGAKLKDINFTTLVAPKEQIKFCMPKYEVSSELNLIPTLQSMGVHDLFTNNANLSNMGNSNNLKVTNVKQNAYIKVDEHGTEADATSVIGIATKAAKSIIVDRPFLSVIVWKDSGAPIFLTQIVNPGAQAA